MGYDRYGRDDQRRDEQDRDEYSSARDYRSADRYADHRGGSGYGARDDRYGRSQGDQQRGWTPQERESGQPYGRRRDDYRDEPERGRRVGVYGGASEPRDYGRQGYSDPRGGGGRPAQGTDQDDRGFIARAGDEVRSWFGDEDAERRREMDARRDEHAGGRGAYGRDEHYHAWRTEQIQGFDRDYHEYREENRDKFHQEFAAFRTERQGQRALVGQVTEHAEVVGADGQHVGTVDKVRGDRIILTKSDADAGGHHHSIPSRWLQSVEGGRVTLRKTAQEAKDHWRDEESAMQQEKGRASRDDADEGRVDLNRSFSGTY